MNINERLRLRLERCRSGSANLQTPGQASADVCENAVVDCGWGRLIFAQTFADSAAMVATTAESIPPLSPMITF